MVALSVSVETLIYINKKVEFLPTEGHLFCFHYSQSDVQRSTYEATQLHLSQEVILTRGVS